MCLILSLTDRFQERKRKSLNNKREYNEQAEAHPKGSKKRCMRGEGGPENGVCNYRGVRQRTCGQWVAKIPVPCQSSSSTLWLGTYQSAYDAALAYDEAARVIYGESAVLNIPELTTSHTVFTIANEYKAWDVKSRNARVEDSDEDSDTDLVVIKESVVDDDEAREFDVEELIALVEDISISVQEKMDGVVGDAPSNLTYHKQYPEANMIGSELKNNGTGSDCREFQEDLDTQDMDLGDVDLGGGEKDVHGSK